MFCSFFTYYSIDLICNVLLIALFSYWFYCTFAENATSLLCSLLVNVEFKTVHSIIPCIVLCHRVYFPVQLQHAAVSLTNDEISAVLNHSDVDQMWARDLKPLLVVRYPGSAGSQAVQEVS